jgi:four helix bundle protein
MTKSDALRARTRRFAGAVIRLYVSLDRGREEIRVLGRQLLRAGTPVGANYREASRARSDYGFIEKIEQCAQEADEAQFWLELLREDSGVKSEFLNQILIESDELIRIFITMSKNTKSNRGNLSVSPE